MTEIFNRSEKRRVRKQLRKNPTEPEKKVWYYIRNAQLGQRFRRQVSIGDYIVDFYCPKPRFIIEIDGDSHYSEVAEEKDRRRTKYFTELGLEVVRFTNKEVAENIEGVILKIKSVVDKNPL